MKIKTGDKLENIKLKSIDNENFDLNKLSGKKILLSFYRFAACPMCNLRLNEINKVPLKRSKNVLNILFIILLMTNIEIKA